MLRDVAWFSFDPLKRQNFVMYLSDFDHLFLDLTNSPFFDISCIIFLRKL
jgi:hypothetical protein